MTSAPAKHAHYFADFQALVQGPGTDAPAWLRDLRDNAWSKFSDTGFPTARRGNERWKYTNVGPIAKIDFSLAGQPISANGSKALVPDYKVAGTAVFDLVYVDGHYSAEMSSPSTSSDGVTVANLASATGDDSSPIEAQLGRLAPPDNDGFAALNTAFLHDGSYVYVADGHTEKMTVRISYITSHDADTKVTYPRTLIVAGRNTDITVVESYTGPTDIVYFTNAVTEIAVGEGARIDHYRLLLEGNKGFHVGTTRVNQEKDSSFNSASFALGTSLARNDMEVLLDAPGAYC